jgi:hypothetical protein
LLTSPQCPHPVADFYKTVSHLLSSFALHLTKIFTSRTLICSLLNSQSLFYPSSNCCSHSLTTFSSSVPVLVVFVQLQPVAPDPKPESMQVLFSLSNALI